MAEGTRPPCVAQQDIDAHHQIEEHHAVTSRMTTNELVVGVMSTTAASAIDKILTVLLRGKAGSFAAKQTGELDRENRCHRRIKGDNATASGNSAFEIVREAEPHRSPRRSPCHGR